MTIKECIDIVDNIKPNQYTMKDKVMWLSFVEEIIINDVLKTHEGYDGRYDYFEGYSEDKLSVSLIVPSPYDRLYTEYLKMMIDKENGETARYNNSMVSYNTYMMEYRKYYNKTHMPLDASGKRDMMPPKQVSVGLSDAEYENLKRDMTYILTEYFSNSVSEDKLYDIVTKFVQNNYELFKKEEAIKNTKDGKGKNSVILNANANNSATGDNAIAGVKNADASGDHSVNLGHTCKTPGYVAFSTGASNESNGNYTNTSGSGNVADAPYSNAINLNNKIGPNAVAAFASGSGNEVTASCGNARNSANKVSGFAGNAEGERTHAKASRTHTQGFGTIASSENQDVIGKWNIEDDKGEFAHILGNGTSDKNRSNAHTVDWKGNGWYCGEVYVGKNREILAKKSWVEGIVGDIGEALDAMIELQESYIGGTSV